MSYAEPVSFVQTGSRTAGTDKVACRNGEASVSAPGSPKAHPRNQPQGASGCLGSVADARLGPNGQGDVDVAVNRCVAHLSPQSPPANSGSSGPCDGCSSCDNGSTIAGVLSTALPMVLSSGTPTPRKSASCVVTANGAGMQGQAQPPAAKAPVAGNLEDSDSDVGQPQVQTARQKKFLKKFKQLPQEEVVLQRYSCALVGDILLQGYLYITDHYFAFYSNVFGYVTRLQIPINSVTKLTKEKTAKIIPNAIGLTTAKHKKHIFSSFLARDSTFKLMNQLWERAVKESGQSEEDTAEILDAVVDAAEMSLETELDAADLEEINDLSTDSEEGQREAEAAASQPASSKQVPDGCYLIKRMNKSNGTVYYQPEERKGDDGQNDGGGGGGSDVDPRASFLEALTRSTTASLVVLGLLAFLLCSSLYLMLRIDSLEKQVESRYWPGQSAADDACDRSSECGSVPDPESSEKMKKVIGSNLDQISTVRKTLEKMSGLLRPDKEKNGGAKDETL